MPTQRMKTITVYGLKNCDSCRKAVKWLRGKGISVQLHDVREDGLPKRLAAELIKTFGPDRVVNQRSTTWRTLSETDRQKCTPKNAVDLILSHPTLLKRPVFDLGKTKFIGFKVQDQAEIEKLL